MSSQRLYSLSQAMATLSLAARGACSSCRFAQSTLRRPHQQSQLLPRTQMRNATHAAAGVANGAKNRPGRRLGAKRGNGEYVTPNTIIFRQRGTLWHAGENAGKGRNHTIVAQQPGYVRYYRDPGRHPDRKYIGVVLHPEDQLPYPTNAPRKRRLGLIAVETTRATNTTGTEEAAHNSEGTDLNVHNEVLDSDTGETAHQPPAGTRWPWESYTDVFTVATKGGKVKTFKQGRGGAYRLSNFDIGRAAEDAGVKVAPYRKDRFLAWRKRNARKIRSALAKTTKTKKSKKAKR